MNPFDVLQIRPGASIDEAKVAYHQLAKKWHPDKYSGTEKQAAEEKFRAISEAYAAIKSGRVSIQTSEPAARPSGQSGQPKEKSHGDWLNDAKSAFLEKRFDNALSMSQYCFNFPEVAEEARLLHAKIIEATSNDVRGLARAYEEVLRINPNNGEAVTRLADLYLALDMPSRAASMSARAKSLGLPASHKQPQPSVDAQPGGKSVGVTGGILGKVTGFLKK